MVSVESSGRGGVGIGGGAVSDCVILANQSSNVANDNDTGRHNLWAISAKVINA